MLFTCILTRKPVLIFKPYVQALYTLPTQLPHVVDFIVHFKWNLYINYL